MNRLPVVWVPAPDEDDPDDFDRYVAFRLREDWLSVDADQLILPITITERDGEEIDPRPAILKQYGGEGLLNDLLMADQQLEPGTKWVIGHQEGTGRYCNPIPTDDELDEADS